MISAFMKLLVGIDNEIYNLHMSHSYICMCDFFLIWLFLNVVKRVDYVNFISMLSVSLISSIVISFAKC